MGSQNSSIVNGFIDEVTTYIPLLRSGIEALSAEPRRVEEVQELHRLVHIIHGAASLVGLVGLSHAAAPVEEALEEAMEGALPVDAPFLDAMAEAVDHFDAFALGRITDRAHEISMVARSVAVFRRLRGLPETGDKEAVALFLEELGEDPGPGDVSVPGVGVPEPDQEPTLCVEGDAEAELLLGDVPSGAEGLDRMPMPEDEDVASVDPFLFDAPPVCPDPFPEQEPDGSPGALPESGDAPSGVAPEILAVFNDEVEEHVESINRNLEALEAQVAEPMIMGADEKEKIRQVRRAVHTIKGASSLVGMTGLPAWAHRVEDLLDWLYDEAEEITPEAVAVLLRATDIMALFLTDPSRVTDHEMSALETDFSRIRGASAGAPAPGAGDGPHGEPGESVGIFDALSVEDEAAMDREAAGAPGPALSGTFRVGMEKLDDLVNLASEQIIALSAFDRKLDAFMGTVSELDLSRARLRETSRSLQVGYEVKAIAKPGAALAEAGDGDPFGDFDSLELDRYSEFNLMLRDLAESAVDIGEIYSVMQTLHSDFEGYVTRQRVLLSELQGKLMHIRMAPMSVITTRMRRAVREVADRLAKQVRLTIRGEGIELDRVIWEKLADPLLHILRNAVDHGIEDPESRRKAGKPDTGIIAVSASREGNQVLIRIRDDGAGLNLAAIRRRAESMAGVDAASLSDEELVSLVFAPGFSTRGEVTEISGRGVGMDVVKTNIEELKGSVRISSPGPGQGTVLLVRIPLTLAVTRAVLCTAAGRTFAVPLNEISDMLRVYPENMVREPMESVRVDDEVFPLYRLSRVLGMADDTASREGVGDRPLVLKIESPERTAALAVDSLVGQQEIVIKSLGSHLQYVKGISGATVMGDGSLVPILNVRELLDGELGDARPAAPVTDPEADTPLEVLIVDDSVSVRQVVARLLESRGWKTTFARDGVEALETLSFLTPDVIVLDVEMPRMNGYEFLSARRSHPSCRTVPVVMLTSRSTAKYREKARALGADGYVVKPFDNRQFLNLIERLAMR